MSDSLEVSHSTGAHQGGPGWLKRLEQVDRHVASAVENVVRDLQDLAVAAEDGAATQLLAATARVDGEKTQSDILLALLEEGCRFASRTAFFLTRPNEVRGWAGRGFGDRAALEDLQFDFNDKGVWARLAQASGTLSLDQEECAAVGDQLGVAAGNRGVLIPFILRGQLGGVLYADRLEGEGTPGQASLQLLTHTAAQAIETAAVRGRGVSPTLRSAGEDEGEAVTLWQPPEVESMADGAPVVETVAAAAAGLAAAAVAAAVVEDAVAVTEEAVTEESVEADVEIESATEDVESVAEVAESVAESVPEVAESTAEVAESVPEVAESIAEVAESVPEVAESAAEEIAEGVAVEDDFDIDDVEESAVFEVVDDEPEEVELEAEAFVADEEVVETVAEAEAEDVPIEAVPTDDSAGVDFEMVSVPEPDAAADLGAEDFAGQELSEIDDISGELEPEPELEDTSDLWAADDAGRDEAPPAVDTAFEVAPPVEDDAPSFAAPPVAEPPVVMPMTPAVGQETVRLDIAALQGQMPTAAPVELPPVEEDTAKLPQWEVESVPKIEPPTPSYDLEPEFAEPVTEPMSSPDFGTSSLDVSEDPTIMTTRASLNPEPPVAEAEPSPMAGGYVPPAPSEVTPPPSSGFAAPPQKSDTGTTQVVPPTDIQGPGSAFGGVVNNGIPDGEEALHEEARRLARLLVSEIKLYNEEIIEEGRRAGNIYDRLKDDIDRSRQMYEERIDPRLKDSGNDYFHQELVQRLAGGDKQLLGY